MGNTGDIITGILGIVHVVLGSNIGDTITRVPVPRSSWSSPFLARSLTAPTMSRRCSIILLALEKPPEVVLPQVGVVPAAMVHKSQNHHCHCHHHYYLTKWSMCSGCCRCCRAPHCPTNRKMSSSCRTMSASASRYRMSRTAAAEWGSQWDMNQSLPSGR